MAKILDNGRNTTLRAERSTTRNVYSSTSKRERKSLYGKCLGISSDEKGFSQSEFDTIRTGFKFATSFDDGTIRFVYAKFPKDYYYMMYGINGDAYVGQWIEVEVEDENLKLGQELVGDIVPFPQDKVKDVATILASASGDDPNRYLVKDNDPLQETVKYDIGIISGIFCSSSKHILNHIFGSQT